LSLARWGLGSVVLASIAFTGTLARGDSFTPVRLQIKLAPVARLHAPLRVTVSVSADPGALDDRTGPLRVQAKLAAECGGTFSYTSGPVLIDRRLSPDPATGRAYSATASASGRPTSFGTQTVCAWLVDEGDGRAWASDQSAQVDVSRACTTAAARYDAVRRRHGRGLASARRAARRACGPGVPV
jgi:hypothetical protein